MKESNVARRTSEWDRSVVHALVVGLRTAELYAPDNAAVGKVVSGLLESIGVRGPGRETIISVRNHSVFVDEDRLRIGPSDYLNFRYLTNLFGRWGIGGLTLCPGVGEDELCDVLYLLAQQRGDYDALLAALRNRSIKHVEVAPMVDEQGGQTGAPSGSLPLRTYCACLDVCQELCEAVRDHRQLRTRRLRRVTQSVVDLVLRDEHALLTMTTIKEFDDYLFTHSANVAVLSVALGQRLGLGKARLGELCLAAFLHDLGKTAISRDLLNKRGDLTDEEWRELRMHPINSVEILLRQEHLSQPTLRAIVGSFEHHLNYDMTGYPTVTRKQSITLFGRIITVVDRYDAITTPRSYRTRNLTPYEGMRHLLQNTGTQFDPLLVRAFLDLLGIYPVGTVVGLDDGRVGVVQRAPLIGSPLDRPVVRVLQGDPGTIVDLSEGPEAGTSPVSVSRVFNPDNRGQLPAIDPAALALVS